MNLIRQRKINCRNNEFFFQNIPAPADIQSFFAFSLPKAGSTLLNAMLQDCCDASAIPIISPYSSAFLNGIVTRSIGKDLDSILYKRGYAYLGFRHFIPYDSKFDFSSVPIILLVRDPRDVLTSLYFSIKYSHALPERQGSAYSKLRGERDRANAVDIDSFVLSVADKYVEIYEDYISNLISKHEIHLYRYEDVIFDKHVWLSEMLDVANINLPNEEIQSIASRHDIRPKREELGAHIRQVTPGNYKKRLSRACIAELNDKFMDAINLFNYSF